jgi:hypothetical protein
MTGVRTKYNSYETRISDIRDLATKYFRCEANIVVRRRRNVIGEEKVAPN